MGLTIEHNIGDNDRTTLFEYGRDLTPYDLLRIFHLASVPSLRKISAHGIHCPRYNPDGHSSDYMEYIQELCAFPVYFSNINELDLRCCQIDSKVLKAICRLPKSLEILRLSSSGNKLVLGSDDLDFTVHRLSLIGEALQYHTKSLRVLELDLDKYVLSPLIMGMNYELRKEDLHSIGTLKDFQALKVLAIGFLTFLVDVNNEDTYEVIYIEDEENTTSNIAIHQKYTHPFRMIDALPASLEVMVIYDYQKEESPRQAHRPEDAWFNHQSSQLAEFMENRREIYPNLKTVRGIDELVHGERVPSPLDELCQEIEISLA